MTTVAELAFQIRPYNEGDEMEVVALLEAAMGKGPAGERSPEFFRWKHLANPFGRSLMLVAEIDDRIVGFRSLMRWEFRASERTISAVRPVDTATHPDVQGRGVFRQLTVEALRQLNGTAGLVYNTPNEKSLPGYLKMGWRIAGSMPVFVRVRHPVRFGLRLGGRRSHSVKPEIRADPAREALSDGLESLLEEAERSDARLHTWRNERYLSWRYGAAPVLDYRVVREEGGGRLTGLAVFRVRPRAGLWETTIAELIVRPGDVATARDLIRRVMRAAGVDHLTTTFPPDATEWRAARRMGFIRAPRGMNLVVNPLRDDLQPDPRDLRSWALRLGDLEVF